MAFDDDVERTNLRAFDKLMGIKQAEEKGALGRCGYWEDLYGNRYGLYYARQADGKFHAFIWKKSGKDVIRKFAKRRKANEWAWKHYSEHNDRQLKARESRRAKAEAKKPHLTDEQKKVMQCEKKLEHYRQLRDKNEKKIKSLQTRSKTYTRRIRYYIVKLQSIKDVEKLEASAK